MAGKRVLVVDDDPVFLRLMEDLLREEGYAFAGWADAGSAFAEAERTVPDLVILDLRFGAAEAGLDVLQLLRLSHKTARIPVIMCSADEAGLRESADYLAEKGAEVVRKPFEIEDIVGAVERAVGPARPERS